MGLRGILSSRFHGQRTRYPRLDDESSFPRVASPNVTSTLSGSSGLSVEKFFLGDRMLLYPEEYFMIMVPSYKYIEFSCQAESDGALMKRKRDRKNNWKSGNFEFSFFKFLIRFDFEKKILTPIQLQNFLFYFRL